MKTRKLKPEGEIRRVSRKEVLVSLFTDRGEVIWEIARTAFPKGTRLKPGQSFSCLIRSCENKEPEVTLVLHEGRRITRKELDQMKLEVEQALPAEVAK
jgi:hypothetical protein